MIPALGPWLVAVSTSSFQACAALPPPAVEPECRTFSGLRAGASVQYEVAGATGTAWTLPASGPTRFAVIGDSGSGRKEQWDVARLLERSEARFLLHTGDVVYPRGALKDYGPRYFQPYRNILPRMAVYPAAGNHDYANEYLRAGRGRRRFEEAYRRVHRRPAYYSVDAGPLHIVSLDVNAAFGVPAAEKIGPGSPQDAWLRADLAASRAPWIVIILHVPVRSTHDHGDHEELQAWLTPLLNKHSVRLVLQGHDHYYERTRPIEGTTFVTVGTGGAPLHGSRGRAADASFAAGVAAHGVLFGEADLEELRLRFVDAGGEVRDSFSIRR